MYIYIYIYIYMHILWWVLFSFVQLEQMKHAYEDAPCSTDTNKNKNIII